MWQRALYRTLIRTSSFLGGSTVISSIETGLPASHATAVQAEILVRTRVHGARLVTKGRECGTNRLCK